jgi:heme exporter protein CcmD
MSWHKLMGHLGPYVWSAYGFVVVVFGALLFRSRRRLTKIKKQLREHYES